MRFVSMVVRRVSTSEGRRVWPSICRGPRGKSGMHAAPYAGRCTGRTPRGWKRKKGGNERVGGGCAGKEGKEER